jgi:hypothetical protein
MINGKPVDHVDFDQTVIRLLKIANAAETKKAGA